MARRQFQLVILGILALFAALSISQGVRNAARYSNDLQWSDVVLLHHHIDPFATYLEGDPQHRLMRWQIPNYLHELYLLEFPLGSLSFYAASCVWAAANLVFFAATLVLLTRFYQLPPRRAALFACLALCSTGFRNSLGNGQQNLFALFCFTLCLCSQQSSQSGWQRTAGLSGLYAKYNFAPVVFAYLLFKRQWRILLTSLLLPILGFLFMAALLDWRKPLHLLIEPFLVSHGGITPGKADIMTILEQLLSAQSGPGLRHPGSMLVALPYLTAIALSLLYGWLLARSNPPAQTTAAAIATATLLFVQHVEYDFILLLVPLACFLRTRLNAYSCWALLLLADLLFLDRWFPLDRFLPGQPARVAYLICLCILILLIHATYRKEAGLHPEPATIHALFDAGLVR